MEKHRLLFIVLVLLISCTSVVFAADDSSGNINVEITKLERGLSYVVFLIIGTVLVAALFLSAILLWRSRKNVHHASKNVVELHHSAELAAFKPEGYYDSVCKDGLPRMDMIDEQEAKPVAESSQDSGTVGRYLKEDERIILNVLRMKHNSCTQATLRVITDFSKARLSRVLSEMEERGVIFKVQQGRKNLITLKADL